MRDKLRMLLDRFASLSSREQMLVLVAVFAVAYQIADFVVLDRQFQQIDEMRGAMAADNAAMLDLNAELSALAADAAKDPNHALRSQIAELRNQTRTLQKRLESEAQQMISPQDMARFLEELLVKNSALNMLSLQTLEAKPLVGPDQKDDRQIAGAVLHQHGFELVFSGGYLATLQYLRTLERLPWRFFWDSVSYQVIDYPESVVRLRLHTLSLSEDWIGV